MGWVIEDKTQGILSVLLNLRYAVQLAQGREIGPRLKGHLYDVVWNELLDMLSRINSENLALYLKRQFAHTTLRPHSYYVR